MPSIAVMGGIAAGKSALCNILVNPIAKEIKNYSYSTDAAVVPNAWPRRYLALESDSLERYEIFDIAAIYSGTNLDERFATLKHILDYVDVILFVVHYAVFEDSEQLENALEIQKRALQFKKPIYLVATHIDEIVSASRLLDECKQTFNLPTYLTCLHPDTPLGIFELLEAVFSNFPEKDNYLHMLAHWQFERSHIVYRQFRDRSSLNWKELDMLIDAIRLTQSPPRKIDKSSGTNISMKDLSSLILGGPGLSLIIIAVFVLLFWLNRHRIYTSYEDMQDEQDEKIEPNVNEDIQSNLQLLNTNSHTEDEPMTNLTSNLVETNTAQTSESNNTQAVVQQNDISNSNNQNSMSDITRQLFSSDKVNFVINIKKRILKRMPDARIEVVEGKNLQISFADSIGAISRKIMVETFKVLFPDLILDNLDKKTRLPASIKITCDSLNEEHVKKFRQIYQEQVDKFTLPINYFEQIFSYTEDEFKDAMINRELTRSMIEVGNLFKPRDKTLNCFVCYSWGNEFASRVPILVTHLRAAGLNVPFDLDNGPGKSNLGVQLNHIEKADRIVVIGTKLLLKKYNTEIEQYRNQVLDELMKKYSIQEHQLAEKNQVWSDEYKKIEENVFKNPVVKRELGLICQLASNSQKDQTRIFPCVFEGNADTSLPFQMRDLIALLDFVQKDYYHATFALIKALYYVDKDDVAFKAIEHQFDAYVRLITQDDYDLQRAKKDDKDHENRLRLSIADAADERRKQDMSVGRFANIRTTPSSPAWKNTQPATPVTLSSNNFTTNRNASSSGVTSSSQQSQNISNNNNNM